VLVRISLQLLESTIDIPKPNDTTLEEDTKEMEDRIRKSKQLQNSEPVTKAAGISTETFYEIRTWAPSFNEGSELERAISFGCRSLQMSRTLYSKCIKGVVPSRPCDRNSLASTGLGKLSYLEFDLQTEIESLTRSKEVAAIIPIAGSRFKVDATLIATTSQGLDRWPSPNRRRHDNQSRPVRGFSYWEYDIISSNPNLRYFHRQHDRSRWPNNYTKPLSLLGCRYHDLSGAGPPSR